VLTVLCFDNPFQGSFQMRKPSQFCLGFLFLFPLAFVGCTSEPAAPPTPAAVSEADKAKMIDEAMAKLSPEDRAIAAAQKVCPVSGEPLGSMGTPIALEINGRKVFICCDSCRQPMADEPEKYLAKLPAPAATPAPAASEEK
jgi:hypothetical protein